MTESFVHETAAGAALLRALLGGAPRRVAPRAEVRDRWLRIHFGGEPPLRHADFDFGWLRERCPRDRLLTARSAERPDRLEVDAAYVDAERRVHVQWREEYDGRRVELLESVYDLDWLRVHAFERCGADA